MIWMRLHFDCSYCHQQWSTVAKMEVIDLNLMAQECPACLHLTLPVREEPVKKQKGEGHAQPES